MVYFAFVKFIFHSYLQTLSPSEYFVISDLHTVVHTQGTGVFIICLHNDFIFLDM
jgi:hypothetical protein